MIGMKEKTQKPSHILAARDRRRLWLVRIALYLASFALATGIIFFELPSDMGRPQALTIGEPASRTFFAPFQISYVNEPATDEIRARKASQVPHVLELQPEITNEIKNKIALIFNPDPESAGLQVLPPGVPHEALRILRDERNIQEAQKALGLLQEMIATQGVLDPAVKNALLQAGSEEAVIVDKETKAEKVLPLAEVLTSADFAAAAEKFASPEVLRSRELKSAILAAAQAVIKPNLSENEIETQARQKKAAASVDPVMVQIKKDQLIIQRGVLMTHEARERLVQVQKKQTEHQVLNRLSATTLLVLSIYFLSFLYLWFFEKKVFASPKLLVLIHIIYLLTLTISKGIALWPGSSYYLMPTALSSVLTAMLIGPRIGFLTGAVMATLVAPMTEFSSEVILMTLIGSSAGTFASLQLRKRVQFLRLGAGIGLASFLVLLAYRVFQEYAFVESFQIAALGLAKGLLVTMPLAFLLLPILEWAFNLTTDITLLELSDLNHPLLKKMIIEAPGTYHHSLVVSTLAEAACETIGANALLARVGCYFHDIGKIARAEFFTENSQQQNRHQNLAPTMSCLIIMNHVKDGLELGKKHKLRESILKFIPEHQGTGVIYYFYRKALDHAKPGEKIDPNNFRYPGPKPQSRETAVALLSDSVEAASRSLQEPTPDSIRQLVRKIINDKFIDGQLDECDLTLRDLYKIQESFVHNLVAIFHTRVKYPTAPVEESRPNLFEEDQFSKFRMDAGEPQHD
jgi:putative nucleotidyltransferase with HDIG domain